jgi:glycosyltransferase involved in cell wall biosynthesis
MQSFGMQTLVLSAAFPRGSAQQVVDGVSIHRYPLPVLHLAAFQFCRRLSSSDAIVSDLAHVLPWPGTRLSSGRSVVFFRHLHSRTLRGQVGPALAQILTLTERTYRVVYGPSATFVTESKAGREDLITLGVTPASIRLIQPGVDSNLFRPRIRSPVPLLVHFSGVRNYKRPEHAIELARRLVESGHQVRLAIVGEGPSIPNLRRVASSLGQDVTFVGHLTRVDLARLVGSAWLHVVCSIAEGWGLSAWEAAAAGVPTVGYSVPGLSESVLDGVTGKLVRDGDLEALTQAAIRLLDADEGWRNRCRDAVANQTWDVVALRWRDLFTE